MSKSPEKLIPQPSDQLLQIVVNSVAEKLTLTPKEDMLFRKLIDINTKDLSTEEMREQVDDQISLAKEEDHIPYEISTLLDKLVGEILIPYSVLTADPYNIEPPITDEEFVEALNDLLERKTTDYLSNWKESLNNIKSRQ